MRIRAFLTHNWRWKLFSLLIAFGAWLYIRTTILGGSAIPRLKIDAVVSEDVVVEFPVTRLTSPADTNFYQLQPGKVNVTLRGAPALVREVKADEFTVSVDLRRAPRTAVSAHMITVTPPKNIQVVAIDPPASLVLRGATNGTQPALVPLSQP